MMSTAWGVSPFEIYEDWTERQFALFSQRLLERMRTQAGMESNGMPRRTGMTLGQFLGFRRK